MTRGRAARLAAAVAAGALLAAARPPIDLGLLACVALVPLFVVWRAARPRAAAAYGFVAGAVYHGLVVTWVWHLSVVAYVALTVALAAYWALVGALVAWLRTRGVTNPWLVAAVWVCGEAAAARFPLGGLSWDEVGYAFHDVAAARAVASMGGVAFVSYLAVALNALLADVVVARSRRRGERGRATAAAAVGVVVVAAVTTIATAGRAEPHRTGVIRVAVLQGNDKDRDLTLEEQQAEYLQHSHLRLASQVRQPVDLIVFPESSMNSLDDSYTPAADPRLADVARAHDSWVLANASVYEPAAGGHAAHDLNLNVLFRPDGTVEGTYAKRHLVPYGERVPLRGLVERIVPSVRDQIPVDFASGHHAGIFDVAGHPIATVICFESAFGYQVRPLVHRGAQLLVVSTNNRSYERSANSAQHVAIGQMRAAETGRPVVQAAISGISAVIDADGNVHARTSLFERTVMEASVATTSGQTPYVRYGEWVLWASLLATGAAIVVALVRRRPAASVDSARADEPADGAALAAGTLASSGDRT